MASTMRRHPVRHGAEASEAYRMGGLVLFGATAVILAALGFEHLGGYIPCPLCLQQRYAYYAGIPLAFAALVLVSADKSRLAQLAFSLITLAFLLNAGLAVYHAGAEWKFWPGPQSCGTLQAITSHGKGLLEGLDKTKVIVCDEAQWRFAGISFAGWNVVASALLALGAARAAVSAGIGR